MNGIITNGDAYRIEQVTKEKLTDLEKLYYSVYRRKRPKEYYFKKYNTSYTGVENIGFIAYNKYGQPIAYYGVIPCFIQYENRIILAAQSADTMTHSQYRLKGMFTKLSKMTFDLCQHSGIKLIFGFPNQNSYPAMIKRLGWVETEKMNRFEISYSNTLEIFFQNVLRGKKIPKGFIVSQPGVPNSLIDEGYAGIYRNNEYLDYKAYSNTLVISIKSADLWVKANKNMIIGDVFMKTDDVEFFFNEIKAVVKKLGLHKIFFQVSGNCNLYRLFASCCQPVLSFPVLFKDFNSGLSLEKIKFTFADIDSF